LCTDKKYEEAIKQFDKVLAIDHKNGEAFLGKGKAFM
jgi:Flp pilus assembly protein TadD